MIANKWSIRWQLLLHIISHHIFPFFSYIRIQSTLFLSIRLFLFFDLFLLLIRSRRHNSRYSMHLYILWSNITKWGDGFLYILQSKMMRTRGNKIIGQNFVVNIYFIQILCFAEHLWKIHMHSVQRTYYLNENIKYYSLLLYILITYNLWNNK